VEEFAVSMWRGGRLEELMNETDFEARWLSPVAAITPTGPEGQGKLPLSTVVSLFLMPCCLDRDEEITETWNWAFP